MILELTLEQDEKTKKIKQEQAPFDLTQAEKDRTAQVMRDFAAANIIRNKPYPEFDFQSLLQRITLDQTSFNQYPGQRSEDPMESWKSMAFRPIVRNKIISIAAHITAATIFPEVYAQNNRDEEDRAAASVMRDLIEWACEQSKYEKTFLYTVVAALVNPAAYIHKEYREVYRKVKEILPDGKWKEKEILDDEESGFKDTPVPVDELWIGNIYVHDIQKQPFLIWRRVLDYGAAQAKYQDRPNWKYVKPGLQFLYSNLYNLFYQQYDVSLQDRLVEEVIYYNKLADLELHFVNGLIMDDPDQPCKRLDKKYPFVKTGYELVDDGRFFYYKSAAFKMARDEEVVNTAYRMVIDGSYLQLMPPAVIFGKTEIGSSVIAPGAITTIDNADNPNASFETIKTNNNLQAGLQIIEKVEESISESTIENLQMPTSRMTAYQFSSIQQQANTLLGIFAKMVGFMVKDYAELLISDILQHLTVGEANQLMEPGQMLKFRKFLLPNKTVKGKSKTRRVEFDLNLPEEGRPYDFMQLSRSIKEEEQKLKDEVEIIKVNPTLFRDLRFRAFVSPEAVTPRSDAVERSLQIEEYDRAIQNPIVAQNPQALEAVTRDLLFGSYDATKGDPDKYLPKAQSAVGVNQALPVSPPGNLSAGLMTGAPPAQSLSQIAKMA